MTLIEAIELELDDRGALTAAKLAVTLQTPLDAVQRALSRMVDAGAVAFDPAFGGTYKPTGKDVNWRPVRRLRDEWAVDHAVYTQSVFNPGAVA